jgi:hypothetical protein
VLFDDVEVNIILEVFAPFHDFNPKNGFKELIDLKKEGNACAICGIVYYKV